MQNTEFQALKNDGEKWMMIHSWVIQGQGWGYWHQDLSRLAKAGCTLRVVVGLDEGIIQFAPLERKDAEDETHGHASCSWTHCLKYRRKPPLLQTPYRCHAETQTSYNGWHPDRHFLTERGGRWRQRRRLRSQISGDQSLCDWMIDLREWAAVASTQTGCLFVSLSL